MDQRPAPTPPDAQVQGMSIVDPAIASSTTSPAADSSHATAADTQIALARQGHQEGSELKAHHRLSLIANDELALGHIIFDPTSPVVRQPQTAAAQAQLQQQPHPQPVLALPLPPLQPAMLNHHQPPQQQRPTQPPASTAAPSGLAFPSLANLMPATSSSSDATATGIPTTLELAILANSAASQHFGMPPPPSSASASASHHFAQQRTRSRSLAQATTISAPFTTRSDPVPGPTAGGAHALIPSASARGAFPTNGLITTPGMPAYPTRIVPPPAGDEAIALGSRARSMSTPQLTSQDDLLGKPSSTVDQALAAHELQRIRAQQLQRALGGSRASPDPSRNRASAASSSVSLTNRLSTSSSHNLVGERIDRPVSASSMAAIPPRSPGFPASEHDPNEDAAGNPLGHAPSSQPQGTSPGDPTQSSLPGWPLTGQGEPSDYLPRVPVVSTYTFHDYPSTTHYAAGAIPFSRPWAITAPPVIVPINPHTFRLARNWAKSGDRPVAFHTLSETLAEMHDALDSVRRTGVRADPAIVSAHRLSIAGLIKQRVVGGDSVAVTWPLPGGLDKVDALVDEVNAWMRRWDRVGVHAVVDWVLGVVTGWAHHLCLPLPGQADMDAFDDWLDHVNEHWMHPRRLHLRNPFDNGLMFLELELLDLPVPPLASTRPL